MEDFFEIDFLPVHTSKSGDAIAIRYGVGGQVYVHVVDGGYASTAPDLTSHLKKYYSTAGIDHVVVTHPDQDHAEGLAPILETFKVGRLWMLRPWIYAPQLLQAFPRFSSVDALAKKFRDAYPYIDELEKIAVRRGIPIEEPFQGKKIGAFTVLSPSPKRYAHLLIASDKTPQTSTAAGLLSGLAGIGRALATLAKAGWGAELFPSDGTSEENEMSVIQYATLAGSKILLTADTGRAGLAEAADYAPSVGLTLPGISRFQVPHHGGRHNVSTEILDRWLGKPLPSKPADGTGTFQAIISSAKEDADHPRKAVVRAMIHRGGKVYTTEDGTVSVYQNAPNRGWTPVSAVPYPEEQEAL